MNTKSQDTKELTANTPVTIEVEGASNELRSFGVRSSKGLSLRPTRSLVKGKSLRPIVMLPRKTKA